MRRSGYNTIRDEDSNKSDDIDGRLDDEEEARITGSDQKPYKALALVFFLFFMGFVSIQL